MILHNFEVQVGTSHGPAEVPSSASPSWSSSVNTGRWECCLSASAPWSHSVNLLVFAAAQATCAIRAPSRVSLEERCIRVAGGLRDIEVQQETACVYQGREPNMQGLSGLSTGKATASIDPMNLKGTFKEPSRNLQGT